MGGHVYLWFVGRRWERPSTGPDLVMDISKKVELIQKCLLMAQSWQKSYGDKRR